MQAGWQAGLFRLTEKAPVIAAVVHQYGANASYIELEWCSWLRLSPVIVHF
jgi:hypothetical protein